MAAEFPGVDFEAGVLIREKGGDAGVGRGLDCERGSGRLRLVGLEELAMEDELPRWDRARVDDSIVGDHQEAGELRFSREVPHGAADGVVEAVDEVVGEEAGAVVGLLGDEGVGRGGVGEVDDVEAAGPGPPSSAKVGPRAVMAAAWGSM